MVTNSIESIIPSGYLQTNANTKACEQYRYVFEQPCLPMVILSHAGCQRLSQVWSLGCSVGWLVTHVTALAYCGHGKRYVFILFEYVSITLTDTNTEWNERMDGWRL